MKYCGYEIGKEITSEQVKKLFSYLHTNYSKEALIMFNQEQLNTIAEQNKNEWVN